MATHTCCVIIRVVRLCLDDMYEITDMNCHFESLLSFHVWETGNVPPHFSLLYFIMLKYIFTIHPLCDTPCCETFHASESQGTVILHRNWKAVENTSPLLW
jgi:hypothetical protein